MVNNEACILDVCLTVIYINNLLTNPAGQNISIHTVSLFIIGKKTWSIHCLGLKTSENLMIKTGGGGGKGGK